VTQRIIILDSEDGNGKTEIAKGLSRHFDMPRFKYEMEHQADFGSSKENRFRLCIQHAMPMLQSFLRQTGQSVIFDRAYPSEWVYSRYFGRESCVASMDMIDKWHADHDAKIIIPFRTERVRDESDYTFLTAGVKKDLAKLYQEFAKWTKCDVLFLQVDDENLDREMRDILAWLKW
jgi:thymidylate kinase